MRIKYFAAMLTVVAQLILAAPAICQEVWDPIEPVNRGIFWFNDKFDRYLLEPVSEGYTEIVPERVRKGIGNALDNLEAPVDIVNSLLQLKFMQFLEQSGRFVVNSTVGVAGIMDIASDFGLPRHEEDFGTTLGHYCIGPGPYIVLPFLGPSNLRDTIGLVADGFADPVYYIPQLEISDTEATAIVAGVKALDAVDTRARLKEAIDAARDSSVDYYLFVQGAYQQYRQGLIYDGEPPEEEYDLEEAAETQAAGEVPPETTEPRTPRESFMAG